MSGVQLNQSISAQVQYQQQIKSNPKEDYSFIEDENIETQQSLDNEEEKTNQKMQDKKNQKIQQQRREKQNNPYYVGRDKIQICFHILNMTSKIGLGALDEVTDWSYYYFSNFQNEELRSMVLFFLVSSLLFELICWMIIFADINLKRVKEKDKGYYDIDEIMRTESSDTRRIWYMVKYSIANLVITLVKSIQLIPASILMTFLIEMKVASFLIHYFFTTVVGVVLTQDICDIIKMDIKKEMRDERIKKLSKVPNSSNKLKENDQDIIDEAEKEKRAILLSGINNEAEMKNEGVIKTMRNQSFEPVEDTQNNKIASNNLTFRNGLGKMQNSPTKNNDGDSLLGQQSPPTVNIDSETKALLKNKLVNNVDNTNKNSQIGSIIYQQNVMLDIQNQAQNKQKKDYEEQVDENSDTMAALDASMEKNFSTYLFKAEIQKLTRTADTVKVLTKAFPMAILQYLNNQLLGESWTVLSVISFATSLVTIVSYGIQIVSSLAQEQLEVMHYAIEKYRQSQSFFYRFFGVNIDKDSIKPQISTIPPFQLLSKIKIKHDVEILTSLANCSTENLKRLRRVKLDMSNCQSQKTNIQECLLRLNSIIDPSNTLVTLTKSQLNINVPDKIYLFKEGILQDFRQTVSIKDGKISLNPTVSVRKIIQNINVGMIAKFLKQSNKSNQIIKSLEINLDFINLKEKKYVFNEIVDYLLKMQADFYLQQDNFCLNLSFRKCKITYVEIDQLMNNLKRLSDAVSSIISFKLRLSLDLRDNDLQAREMQTLGRNLKQLNFLSGLHLNLGNNSFEENGFLIFCDEISNSEDNNSEQKTIEQQSKQMQNSLEYLEIAICNYKLFESDEQNKKSSLNNKKFLTDWIKSLKKLKGLKLVFNKIKEDEYVEESSLLLALQDKIANLQYFIFSKNQINSDSNSVIQSDVIAQEANDDKKDMILNFLKNAQQCSHLSYNEQYNNVVPFSALNFQSYNPKTVIVNLQQFSCEPCLDILRSNQSQNQQLPETVQNKKNNTQQNTNIEINALQQPKPDQFSHHYLLMNIQTLELIIDIQSYTYDQCVLIIQQVWPILDINSNTLNELRLDIRVLEKNKTCLKHLKFDNWENIQAFDLKLNISDKDSRMIALQNSNKKELSEKQKLDAIQEEEEEKIQNNIQLSKNNQDATKKIQNQQIDNANQANQNEEEFNLKQIFSVKGIGPQETSFPLKKLTLEVSLLKIGDVFQFFSEKFYSLTFLKFVLNNNHLSLQNLTHLQDLLAKQSECLEFLHLDFENSNIDKNACYNLGKAIKKLYFVEKLYLNLAKNPNIKEKGAHFISESLKSLIKLKSLILDFRQTNSSENFGTKNQDVDHLTQILGQEASQEIKYNKFYESISKLVELEELQIDFSQNKGLKISEAINFFDTLSDLKFLKKLTFLMDDELQDLEQAQIRNQQDYNAQEKYDRAKILKSYKLLLNYVKKIKNLSQLKIKIYDISKKIKTANKKDEQQPPLCQEGHKLQSIQKNNKNKQKNNLRKCGGNYCKKSRLTKKIVFHCDECNIYLCQYCQDNIKRDKEKETKQQMQKWINLNEAAKKLFRAEEVNFRHYQFALIDKLSIVQEGSTSEQFLNKFMVNYEDRYKNFEVNLSNKYSNTLNQQPKYNSVSEHDQAKQKSFWKCLPCYSNAQSVSEQLNSKMIFTKLINFMQNMRTNQIVSLNLGYQILSNEQYAQLCHEISQLKAVQSFKIVLTNFKIGDLDKNLDQANQSKIRPMSQQKIIQDNNGKHMNFVQINQIFNCLVKLDKLKSVNLKLDKNQLVVQHEDFNKSLEQFRALKSFKLNLGDAQIDQKAFQSIFESLNNMQELENLSLNFSKAKLDWDNKIPISSQHPSENNIINIEPVANQFINNENLPRNLIINFISRLKSIKFNFSGTKLNLADINIITEQFKTLKNLQQLSINIDEMLQFTDVETELKQFIHNIREVIRNLHSFGISVAKNNFNQKQLGQISKLFMNLSDEHIKNKKELKINIGYQLKSQQMPQKILNTIEQMKELNILKLKIGETQLFKRVSEQQNELRLDSILRQTQNLQSNHNNQVEEKQQDDEQQNSYTQLCKIIQKKNLLTVLVLDLSETMSEINSKNIAGTGQLVILFQAVAKIPQLLTLKLTLKNNLIHDEQIDSCQEAFNKILNLEILYLNLRSNDLKWPATQKIIANLAFRQKNIQSISLDFNSNNIDLFSVEIQAEIETMLQYKNIQQKLQNLKNFVLDLRDQRQQEVVRSKDSMEVNQNQKGNRKITILLPQSKDYVQNNISKWSVLIDGRVDELVLHKNKIHQLANKNKLYFDVNNIKEEMQEEQVEIFLKEVQKKKQLQALDIDLKSITVSNSQLVQLAEIFATKLKKIQILDLNLRKNDVETNEFDEFTKSIYQNLKLKDFRIDLTESSKLNSQDIYLFLGRIFKTQYRTLKTLQFKLKKKQDNFDLKNLMLNLSRLYNLENLKIYLQNTYVEPMEEKSFFLRNSNLTNIHINLKSTGLSLKICLQILVEILAYNTNDSRIKKLYLNLTNNDAIVEIFKINLSEKFQQFDLINYPSSGDQESIKNNQQHPANQNTGYLNQSLNTFLLNGIQIYKLIQIMSFSKENKKTEATQSLNLAEDNRIMCFPEMVQGQRDVEFTGYFKIFSLQESTCEIPIQQNSNEELELILKQIYDNKDTKKLATYYDIDKVMQLSIDQIQLINQTCSQRNNYQQLSAYGYFYDKNAQKSINNQAYSIYQNQGNNKIFMHLLFKDKEYHEIELSKYSENLQDLRVTGNVSLLQAQQSLQFKHLQILQIEQIQNEQDKIQNIKINIISEALLSIETLDTFQFKHQNLAINNQEAIHFSNSIISQKKLVNLKIILQSFGSGDNFLTCVQAIFDRKQMQKRKMQEEIDFDENIMEENMNNQGSTSKSMISVPSFVSLSVQGDEDNQVQDYCISPERQKMGQKQEQFQIKIPEIQSSTQKEYLEFEIQITNNNLNQEQQLKLANFTIQNLSPNQKSVCINFKGRFFQYPINSMKENRNLQKIVYTSQDQNILLFKNLQINNCNNLKELRVQFLGLKDTNNKDKQFEQAISSISQLSQLETLYFATDLYSQETVEAILQNIVQLRKLRYLYLYLQYYDLDNVSINTVNKFFAEMSQLETIYLMSYKITWSIDQMQKLAAILKRCLELRQITFNFRNQGMSEIQLQYLLQIAKQFNNIQQLYVRLQNSDQFRVTNFKKHETINTYQSEILQEWKTWCQSI